MADKDTIYYGLVGYPLGHSFSRKFFNDRFASEHRNAEYVNFEIPDIEQFPEAIAKCGNVAGLNVTIPYKKQVIHLLDDMDTAAREMGAVNVIKFVKTIDGKIRLKGYNSDVIGFCDSIRPMLCAEDRKALILGTGGASQAVEYGLKSLGLQVQFVSRHHSERAIAYEEIAPEMLTEQYSVIVNCTPLGMFPKVDACPNIDYSLLSSRHLCYDLVYNPEQTLFLRRAAERGARTKNGLEMLHLQALAAWEIWNK